ncbi:MAG: hypothetical protein ACE5LF_01960, partial [Alphaproteobacteria bacterium]
PGPDQASVLAREIPEQGTADRTPDQFADVTKFRIGTAILRLEIPVEEFMKLAGGLPTEHLDRGFLPVKERFLRR